MIFCSSLHYITPVLLLGDRRRKMDKRFIVMKPKLFIAAAGMSLLLAYPVSHTIAYRDKIIQSQKRENNTLEFHIQQLQKQVKPKPVVTKAAIEPAPTSTPIVVKLASFSCENYSGYFNQYSWNPNVAMAICQAESDGDPDAISNSDINPDGVSDFGLMQLHGIDILDPGQNIAYAYYHKYLTQGWGAWSTYTSGKYAQYL